MKITEYIKKNRIYGHSIVPSLASVRYRINLTKFACGTIINPVFMKGARSMKYYVVIRIDMACLAPYALSR